MEYIRMMIDDGYINEMAEYYVRQGTQLQKIAESYIDVIRQVTEEGIVQGDTADKLKTYLAYAEKLRHTILDVSIKAGNLTGSYLEDIYKQDQYRF